MNDNNTLYKFLNTCNIKYSEKNIRRSIIVIRITTNERLRNKHKDFIFQSVSKIIVRNVNNFFNLIQDIEKGHVIHEKDDIVNECFVILQNCIDKFNLTNKSFKFYFYLNKACSQGLYRLKEKHYCNKSNKHQYNDVNDILNFDSSTFTSSSSYPLFLDKNFTKKEILLMQSKLDEEKIEDFCKKIEISKNEYYKILKNIRVKIQKNYIK